MQLMQSTAAELAALAERPDLPAAASQAGVALRACCLLESMRGATRAALSATQPAIFALSAPLLRPLLLLQRASHGHSMVVALILKLAAEMVSAGGMLSGRHSHLSVPCYHQWSCPPSQPRTMSSKHLSLQTWCTSSSSPPQVENHIISDAKPTFLLMQNLLSYKNPPQRDANLLPAQPADIIISAIVLAGEWCRAWHVHERR